MSTPRWHGDLAEEMAAGNTGVAAITVLRDPDDEVAVTRALLDAHAPAAGVVTVHPTPATTSGLALAADTLQALGRSLRRVSEEQVSATESMSRAVVAWFLAGRIRHLVVLRAHGLTADQLAWLLKLRRSTSLRLVLVWHSRNPVRWGPVGLEKLPHHLTDDVTDVLGNLDTGRRPAADASATAEVDLPQVPDTDVRTFRGDAAAALPHKQFARVDATYAWATRATCRWIADHTGRRCNHTRRRRSAGVWLGVEDVELAERMLELLRHRRASVRELYERRPDELIRGWQEIIGLYRVVGEIVADSPGPNSTVTRLRGVQAAFDLHGIRLRLPENLPYCVGPGLTTTPITQRVVDRILTSTANPAHAAAVAVQLFTGATVEGLKEIPCVAYTGDALIYTSSHFGEPASLCVWVIPPRARPLVDAAVVFQEARAKPSLQLLSGGIGAYGQRLRDTATAAGLTIPARHFWHHGWIWQTGMLWRGYRPVPPEHKQPRHPNVPTFKRTIHIVDTVPIEEPASLPTPQALRRRTYRR